jgi:F0F1-type ATP synthase assembly protein I
MDETAEHPRGPDRRQSPTPMVSRWTFNGRRRGGRREDEQDFLYVDRPGFWAVSGFVAILAMSIADAAFTLSLLRHGAEEANPVMQAALHLGDAHFVFIKTIVTALAAAFLCLHKNWPLGRACTLIAITGYAALTVYHIRAHQILT